MRFNKCSLNAKYMLNNAIKYAIGITGKFEMDTKTD